MIIELAGALAFGALGRYVAVRDRRAATEHEAELLRRIVANPCRGLPAGSGLVVEGEVLAGLAPASPALSPGRRQVTAEETCNGQLIRHMDGHLTCQGGREDCWAEIPEHRPQFDHPRGKVDCGVHYRHAHGCGECQTLGAASPR